MKPVTLEVISLIPGLFDGWAHCEFMSDQVGLKKKKDNMILNEYPEEVKEDYLYLSNWIREISQKYGPKILIKIIDAQSLQGIYKAIRHWVFRYPAFIINNKKKYVGKDKNQLDALLQEQILTS